MQFARRAPLLPALRDGSLSQVNFRRYTAVVFFLLLTDPVREGNAMSHVEGRGGGYGSLTLRGAYVRQRENS